MSKALRNCFMQGNVAAIKLKCITAWVAIRLLTLSGATVDVEAVALR